MTKITGQTILEPQLTILGAAMPLNRSVYGIFLKSNKNLVFRELQQIILRGGTPTQKQTIQRKSTFSSTAATV
jgi:hypothetical protein